MLIVLISVVFGSVKDVGCIDTSSALSVVLIISSINYYITIVGARFGT